ncbi:hypothetical protein AV530_016081 [Patagioenas fasciata monilis]|uniref:Uncharacterized protein n=1 Tax=Patagioenas fasciata monilis TaxID=372326 RepID=A0A1V4KK18_PATFA|nr:hypothetical protein AV530_016081 [Patagioenas fasciata monilis]
MALAARQVWKAETRSTQHLQRHQRPIAEHQPQALAGFHQLDHHEDLHSLRFAPGSVLILGDADVLRGTVTCGLKAERSHCRILLTTT